MTPGAVIAARAATALTGLILAVVFAVIRHASGTDCPKSCPCHATP